MIQRTTNFSAGPAVLPVPVLERVQRELLALPGPRASILEISHRSATFKEIMAAAETNLRQLLSIPDNYTVLFLQGGSRLQFSMVPMNLLDGPRAQADYIVTGSWGRHAATEARKFGDVRMAWDGSKANYVCTPADSQIDSSPSSGYTYFVSNETIEGVQFATEPATQNSTLVCDASSDLLHKPLDISQYGLIYACAQKNIGPAGVTIVIMRNDLLARSGDALPGYLSYKSHADGGSLFNTAPTFAIYVVRLVTDWLLNDIGGLEEMHALNKKKANMLYQVIDQSGGFYQGHAQADCRSLMNVVFRLTSDPLSAAFVKEAAEQNLAALVGHRSVGGIRASIYNAMPLEGVEALRDFMIQFRKKNT
ncbi:MAG: 3-phosphoserine/phosphohydroxythreonine transaminase [Pirellulales bacterium]|nr:3-phosphoserine/phosphohydroxythreonine transaminase [Pirellulales bacterium]